ncbi:hypothetical protein HY389_01700 [Candidatus Daviesbacteria bacterium]|nr:hypothetical protein [Candidatus Daviesbacteria bacterium]
MGSFLRLVLSLVIGALGLLLTLAGMNLVALSASLSLYVGLILLVVAIVLYIARGNKKKLVEDK